MFGRNKNKKDKKVTQPGVVPMPVMQQPSAFSASMTESPITITITPICTPEGGFACEMKNTGKEDIVITKFCINNFANALRNSGLGRNFYGAIKKGKKKSFDMKFVGHDLANRDPILFDFLWQENSTPIYIDDRNTPFKITKVIRNP